jgi:protein-L-isoaspartate(D-aspartate) O-methyltransferase
MNFEQARFNMVEQQVRTWEVLDPVILNLISTIKREDFVPTAQRNLAFADLELPLGHGQKMWTPKMAARVVQDLRLTGQERVLEIGTGSGYVTALLSARSKEVRSIEINPAIAQAAQAHLDAAGVMNVELVVGDGFALAAKGAPYDVVVFNGSLPVMLDAAFDWITPGGRVFAAVGIAPVMQARVYTRTPEGSVLTDGLFETVIDPLTNAPQPKKFTF